MILGWERRRVAHFHNRKCPVRFFLFSFLDFHWVFVSQPTHVGPTIVTKSVAAAPLLRTEEGVGGRLARANLGSKSEAAHLRHVLANFPSRRLVAQLLRLLSKDSAAKRSRTSHDLVGDVSHPVFVATTWATGRCASPAAWCRHEATWARDASHLTGTVLVSIARAPASFLLHIKSGEKQYQVTQTTLDRVNLSEHEEGNLAGIYSAKQRPCFNLQIRSIIIN